MYWDVLCNVVYCISIHVCIGMYYGVCVISSAAAGRSLEQSTLPLMSVLRSGNRLASPQAFLSAGGLVIRIHSSLVLGLGEHTHLLIT